MKRIIFFTIAVFIFSQLHAVEFSIKPRTGFVYGSMNKYIFSSRTEQMRAAGGMEDGGFGTSFEKINNAIVRDMAFYRDFFFLPFRTIKNSNFHFMLPLISIIWND